MTAKAAIFVSKRLQRPATALLCLMLAQMMLALANCEAETSPMAARVPITAAP